MPPISHIPPRPERGAGRGRSGLLAQLSLASILFRVSDPAAALPLFESYFRSASPGDPVYEEALLEHGRALRAAGRHQEAADRFMLLLLRDPLRHTLYSELAAS